ncbi:MAG TPA: hypothetical protein VL333_02935 [Candidatus Saccharimonadales bacterium]|nr:hypothetical protein [Candidatus Saccharimonadales bacterium]
MTPTGDREQPHSGLVVEDDDDGAPRAGLGERKTTSTILALTALVLVGIAALLAEPPRTVAGQPSNSPSPALSRNGSGTPLPTEAEAWGAIWTRANGVAVLRPTWLPKNKDEYQFFPDASTSRDGFFTYDMAYYELHSVIGTTVWNVEFSADSLDGQPRALQQFGGAAQDAKAPGYAAKLFGNGSPGWTLVWSEGNYRYAIQAFGVSREDLLHITDSLAPVIDGTGRTMPAR